MSEFTKSGKNVLTVSDSELKIAYITLMKNYKPVIGIDRCAVTSNAGLLANLQEGFLRSLKHFQRKQIHTSMFVNGELETQRAVTCPPHLLK